VGLVDEGGIMASNIEHGVGFWNWIGEPPLNTELYCVKVKPLRKQRPNSKRLRSLSCHAVGFTDVSYALIVERGLHLSYHQVTGLSLRRLYVTNLSRREWPRHLVACEGFGLVLLESAQLWSPVQSKLLIKNNRPKRE
jgi:hypothetical protein